MKNIVFILGLFAATIVQAQGLFDKFDDLDDVSSVVVTKDAFDLLRKFPDARTDDMKVFNTAKGLQELKVFSTEKTSIAVEMESIVNKAIKEGNLTQLVRVKDKGSRVKIYIKATDNKDIVSEVLMFVKTNDKKLKDKKIPSSTVIHLLGKINVNELAKIADDYQKK